MLYSAGYDLQNYFHCKNVEDGAVQHVQKIPVLFINARIGFYPDDHSGCDDDGCNKIPECSRVYKAIDLVDHMGIVVFENRRILQFIFINRALYDLV
jgi:hypothetical protein